MAAAYFISDAHLGLGSREEERRKQDRLLSFLDHLRGGTEQLFILGDLFDAWIEYRTVIPKGFHRILTALDDLVRNGVTIHYLAGNHDYWMRDYFRKELGIQTHPESFDIVVEGKRVYLHHGDGLGKGDRGYKILKRVLRNPLSIWLYGWLHPDIGISLARSSSQTSRRYMSGKDAGNDDAMLAFASAKISEGYDYVIMGHRHEPTERRCGGGTYINLGDWITHNTYAVMNGGSIALEKWSQAGSSARTQSDRKGRVT